MPDPTYEAAVGVGNAPAYRGRSSVFIEGLNLGGSGQMPILTFEVCSSVASGTPTVHSLWTVHDTGWPYRALGSVGWSETEPYLIPVYEFFGSGGLIYSYNPVTTITEFVGYLGISYPGIDSPNLKKGVSDVSCLAFSQYDQRDIARMFFTDSPAETFGFPDHGKAFVANPYARRKGITVFGKPPDFFGAGTTQQMFKFPGAIGTGDLAYSINSIAIGDSVAYAFGSDGQVHQFNLSDMSETTTFGFPYSYPGNTTTDIITNDVGDLFIFGNGSGGWLYKRVSGAWVLVMQGLLSGGVLPTVYDTLAAPPAIAGSTLFNADVTIHAGSLSFPEIFNSVPEPLDQVVRRLCLRTGLLTDSDIDVTDLASDEVRAFAVTQVSPTRNAIETLMAGYFFEAVEGPKIKFVKRGGAPVLTIPYSKLGASTNEQVQQLPIKRLNDIELPARVTVKYANMNNDFQDGSESGDRLVTQSTAEQVLQLLIGFTPGEAKKVADVFTNDLAVSSISIGPISVGREYPELECTDVIHVVGKTGTVFRTRIQRATRARGVTTFELVLDDASVITSVATTDEDYTSSESVALKVEAIAKYLDTAIFSDADDDCGFYAVMKGPPDGQLYDSLDNVIFAKRADFSARSVFGNCTTTMPSWTGGSVFDEASVLRVNVDKGELSSTTISAMLASNKVNSCAIGTTDRIELCQFRTATLVSSSPNIYDLTGWIRGARGTEQMSSGHVADEMFVLLTTAARRVTKLESDLGVVEYYKPVRIGGILSSVISETFTNNGNGKKPFAPVNMFYDGASVTWNRRDRHVTRLVSSLGIYVPMSETAESYDVEFLDGSDVVLSTKTVSSPSVPIDGISLAWKFADDTAQFVLEAAGETVCVRYDSGVPWGMVYKLTALHARTDHKFIPYHTYQSLITGMVVIGSDVYYSFIDGANPSQILKSSISDLQTITAIYTAPATADLASGICTDGTSIFARQMYTGNVIRLDSTLTVIDTYATPTGSPVQASGGYLWVAGNPSLSIPNKKIEISTGTITTYSGFNGYFYINGSLGYKLYSDHVIVFDIATGVDLFTYAATQCPFAQVQFVEALGCIAVAGRRALIGAPFGYVLLIDPITGLQVGTIDIPNLYMIAGGSATKLYVTTQRTIGSATYFETFAYEVTAIAPAKVRVYQISTVVGRGYPSTLTI
jgi:hypothetical protein